MLIRHDPAFVDAFHIRTASAFGDKVASMKTMYKNCLMAGTRTGGGRAKLDDEAYALLEQAFHTEMQLSRQGATRQVMMPMARNHQVPGASNGSATPAMRQIERGAALTTTHTPSGTHPAATQIASSNSNPGLVLRINGSQSQEVPRPPATSGTQSSAASVAFDTPHPIFPYYGESYSNAQAGQVARMTGSQSQAVPGPPAATQSAAASVAFDTPHPIFPYYGESYSNAGQVARMTGSQSQAVPGPPAATGSQPASVAVASTNVQLGDEFDYTPFANRSVRRAAAAPRTASVAESASAHSASGSATNDEPPAALSTQDAHKRRMSAVVQRKATQLAAISQPVSSMLGTLTNKMDGFMSQLLTLIDAKKRRVESQVHTPALNVNTASTSSGSSAVAKVAAVPLFNARGLNAMGLAPDFTPAFSTTPSQPASQAAPTAPAASQSANPAVTTPADWGSYVVNNGWGGSMGPARSSPVISHYGTATSSEMQA